MTGLTLHQPTPHGPVYGPAEGAGLPGVVVVHGAEGPMAGWSHRFAAILAAHGFLALPVSYGAGDFFGAGAIREVDLSTLPAAGAALASHSRSNGRVGLFGWSKGAEAVLTTAALTDRFACIAAHAPPDRITGALDPATLRAGGRWLLDRPDDPRAWVWPGQDHRLAPGTPLPVTDATAPIFLSTGTADEVWPADQTLRLARRLEAAGRPPELYLAEGQGHGFDYDTEPELWARLTNFLRRHLHG